MLKFDLKTLRKTRDELAQKSDALSIGVAALLDQHIQQREMAGEELHYHQTPEFGLEPCTARHDGD